MDELDDQLESQQGDLQSAEFEIDQQKVRLERESPFVDTTNQAQVDAFNSKVSELKRRIQVFNENIDSHNALQDAQNAKIDGYNLKCGNKRYYQDDMDAARKAVGLSD